MMREITNFVFEFEVNGEKVYESGSGMTQFNAESNAVIKLMREKGFRYDDIKFVRVESKTPTGVWDK